MHLIMLLFINLVMHYFYLYLEIKYLYYLAHHIVFSSPGIFSISNNDTNLVCNIISFSLSEFLFPFLATSFLL